MPLPIAPVAGFAVRAVAVSLATYAVIRAREGLARHQHVEDAFDDLPDGVAYRRDADGGRAGVRWKRTIRAGANGPGVTVDFTGLARLRITRAP